MWELMFTEPCLPFAVSLILLGLITVIEVGGLLLAGLDFGELLDAMIPDWMCDFDFDIDPNIEPLADAGAVDGLEDLPFFAKALSWLNIGKVPTIVLLVVFMVSFGLVGLGMQSILHSLTGFMLPAFISWIPALFISLPIVKFIGGGIGKVFKKEETSAVRESTFMGKVATISYGTARYDLAARAILRDKHGNKHNVLVYPDSKNEQFPKGTEVLLVRREGGRFRAIKYTGHKVVD